MELELSVLIEVRIGVEPNPVHSFEIFAIPSDLLFLKLPFAVRPGLTDSSVQANLRVLPSSFILSNCTSKMKVEKDNCPRLQCEAKANDHWVSFLGYHFNFFYWLESVDGKMQPGIIFERRS